MPPWGSQAIDEAPASAISRSSSSAATSGEEALPAHSTMQLLCHEPWSAGGVGGQSRGRRAARSAS